MAGVGRRGAGIDLESLGITVSLALEVNCSLVRGFLLGLGFFVGGPSAPFTFLFLAALIFDGSGLGSSGRELEVSDAEVGRFSDSPWLSDLTGFDEDSLISFSLVSASLFGSPFKNRGVHYVKYNGVGDMAAWREKGTGEKGTRKKLYPKQRGKIP